MSSRTPVFFRGSLVGYFYVAERRFVRRCNLQRAIVRKCSAIPLHEEILEKLRALGVSGIEFVDSGSGDRYVAPLAAFFSHRAIRLDLGRGAQRALPLAEWNYYPADSRLAARVASRSAVLTMNAAVIRAALADWSNQPCWLIANARKTPCDRHGAPLRGWTDKGALLQQALAFVDGRVVVGVGLNLNRARGVLFLDFDDCIGADGRITSALAIHLLHQRPTYAERSLSGRGLHLAYRIPADAPPISRKVPEVEAYAHTSRFVLLTGDLHPYGTVHLAEAPPHLLAELQPR